MGLFLIVSLAMLCFIGVNIPQLGSASPSFLRAWRVSHPFLSTVAGAFWLNQMYVSPLFLSIVALLSVALTCSLIQVFRSVRNRDGAKRAIGQWPRGTLVSFPVEDRSALDLAAQRLRRRGYHVRLISSRTVRAVKNDFTRWGTLLLHAGMLTVVVSSLVYVALERRGFAQIIEGDTFFADHDEFLTQSESAFSRTFHPDLALSLTKFTADYYSDGEIKELSSSVAAANSSSEPAASLITVNHPLDVNGVRVYQSTSFGYTVCLIFERNGQRIPTYFSLDHPRKLGDPFVGETDFPKTELLMNFRLHADTRHQSFELDHPCLSLNVSQKDSVLFRGSLEVGDKIPVADGMLTFAEVRRWSGFVFSETYGVGAVFAGFGLILLGLVCVYFFPLREIIVVLAQEERSRQLLFAGIARREKALFAEEFTGIVEEVYLNEGAVHVGTELAEV